MLNSRIKARRCPEELLLKPPDHPRNSGRELIISARCRFTLYIPHRLGIHVLEMDSVSMALYTVDAHTHTSGRKPTTNAYTATAVVAIAQHADLLQVEHGLLQLLISSARLQQQTPCLAYPSAHLAACQGQTLANVCLVLDTRLCPHAPEPQSDRARDHLRPDVPSQATAAPPPPRGTFIRTAISRRSFGKHARPAASRNVR